jgi:hypothetical protein
MTPPRGAQSCSPAARRTLRTYLLNAVSYVEAAPSQEQNMSIPTQMSLVGFVASAAELHFTKVDGTFTKVRDAPVGVFGLVIADFH